MYALPVAPVALDVRRLARDLVVSMAALQVAIAVLDAAFHLGGGIATAELAAVFDATSEGGLASFVMVTQMALVAATLGALTLAYRAAGLEAARVRGWGALAALFAYLALDDGVRLHEGVGSAFADSALAGSAVGAAFPSYSWQLVLGPVFAAAGLAMVVFLWRELGTARRRGLVAAACGLVAVAVGLDFVDGLGANHPLNLYARLTETGLADGAARAFGMGPFDVVLHGSRVLEEAAETLAFTLLWAAFLLHLGDTLARVTVELAPAGAAASGRNPRSSKPGNAVPAREARRPAERLRAMPSPLGRPAGMDGV